MLRGRPCKVILKTCKTWCALKSERARSIEQEARGSVGIFSLAKSFRDLHPEIHVSLRVLQYVGDYRLQAFLVKLECEGPMLRISARKIFLFIRHTERVGPECSAGTVMRGQPGVRRHVDNSQGVFDQ